MKFQTTKEERKIIDKLDLYEIENWINLKEYWRVFRAVINATKENLLEIK